MSKVKKLLDILIKKCEAKVSPVNNNSNKFGDSQGLPKEYLEFMNLTDGLGLSISEILDTSNREFAFIETNKEYKREFLGAFNKGYKAESYVLFASDGIGGNYAFSTQLKDKKVYYFDHENPDCLKTYRSFIHFLKDVIKQELELL
ncbi:MAG: SMI1/KNR4 family protein [Firmicutes bacterium]|nr:SMI1/KNR4 family protein [Bacillota bacterium]